jgi:hypothetical protein
MIQPKALVAGAVDAGYPRDILLPVSKVLISIPDELLADIDREASARGDSRSGFFQEAARRELGRPSKARIEAALVRGRRALRDSGAFEAADVIREGRDARDAADRSR